MKENSLYKNSEGVVVKTLSFRYDNFFGRVVAVPKDTAVNLGDVPCNSDDDCPEGAICINGYCVPYSSQHNNHIDHNYKVGNIYSFRIHDHWEDLSPESPEPPEPVIDVDKDWVESRITYATLYNPYNHSPGMIISDIGTVAFYKPNLTPLDATDVKPLPSYKEIREKWADGKRSIGRPLQHREPKAPANTPVPKPYVAPKPLPMSDFNRREFNFY